MNASPHSIRRRALLALPTAVIVAAAMAAPSVAATPASAGAPVVGSAPTTVAVPTSQGIIMRDGGVCDPIRHMGC
jgi:hypothetical protein